MKDDPSEPATMRLPECLDNSGVASLASSFQVKRGASLHVDASAVKRLTTPCVQVLLSAVATWKADKQELRFEQASTDLVDAIHQLGITPAQLKIGSDTK